VVEASLHLTGECRDTTVVDGGGNGTVVTVAAPDVVVSNLTVRNSGAAGSGRAGILLSASGCIVRDVVLRDNEYGVICDGPGQRVSRSLAMDNIGGILLRNAAMCAVEGNVLDGNRLSGVSLQQEAADNVVSGNRIINGSTAQGVLAGGTGNHIEGNVISGQRYGGLQLLSSGNVVANNSFAGCGLGAMYSYRSNVVRGNTVNGKPLVYLEGVSDVAVARAGQVFLVDCTRVTVSGQQLCNTTVAVELLGSTGCHVAGNNISGNLAGVMLWNASRNHVTGNVISGNMFEGVDVGPFSHHTRIEDNDISGNNDGISLWSRGNVVTGNVISDNWHGVQLDLSDGNTVTGNMVADNTEGISLWQESHGNNLTGNVCRDNTRAISLHYGNTGNNISGNHVTGSEYGIDISPSSDGNRLEANNLTGNMVGVWIGSTGNVIRYNTFMDSKRWHATFISADREPLIPRNRWNRNYWGRPHLLPRPILGWRLPFPWLNVDWRPLLQPYQG
ncbi:MAG: NosD domain-containing protein, partial [Thermoplasmatota archaeon]